MATISLLDNLPDRLRERLAMLRLRQIDVAGAVLVVILHVLVIWAISLNIAPKVSPPQIDELHVAFFRTLPQPNPAEPPPVELAPLIQQPPTIVVEDDPSRTSVAVVSPADVLAPRPDPSHPNEPPSAATMQGSPTKVPPIFLNLLVMEDGTVETATIVQSSGDSSIDDRVIAYVKAHWRFLPALVKQQTAIQYWMTVAVRFAA
jgi:TonB family protein